MATSSDWLSVISEAGGPVGEHVEWIEALSRSSEFSEGWPTRADALPAQSQDAAPDAIAEAFEQGLAEGKAAANAEAQVEIARMLRLSFRDLDRAALDALASALQETVLALCGQVLDLADIDREALEERCRQAAARLGSVAGRCKLHLHPDDLAMLGEDTFPDWTLLSDPELDRGALLLESEEGSVHDGPRQWRRAIAEALAA